MPGVNILQHPSMPLPPYFRYLRNMHITYIYENAAILYYSHQSIPRQDGPCKHIEVFAKVNFLIQTFTHTHSAYHFLDLYLVHVKFPFTLYKFSYDILIQICVRLTCGMSVRCVVWFFCDILYKRNLHISSGQKFVFYWKLSYF